MRVLLALLLLGAPALADDESQARKLYQDGRQAYEAHDFARAYGLFKQAYLESQRPELLFNMAASLQGMERPHDAAEALAAYLRVKPDDPDRPSIEQQIRALEEKQHLMDQDRPKPSPAPQLPQVPQVIVRAEPPSPRETRPSRRGLAIGLGVAGAIVVAVGVGLAVGLTVGASSEPYTTSTIGNWKITP